MTFYAYGAFLSLAAAVGCAVFAALGRRAAALWPWLALVVPVSLVVSRATYCAADLSFYLFDISNPAAMARVWEGGLSLLGALAGAALWTAACAKFAQKRPAAALDALSPALCAFIAIARFAEITMDKGYGPAFDGAAAGLFLRALPHGARLSTALIEGLAALLIGAALLPLRKKVVKRPGDAFLLFMLLFCATQLIMESLRRDGHMMWGFVHAEQAFCMALCAVPFAVVAARNGKLAFGLLCPLLLAGAITGIEFALDRTAVSPAVLYGAFAALLVEFMAQGLRWMLRANQPIKEGMPA